MPRFYEPDLSAEPDSPFARDAAHKLVRQSYWLDINDRSLGMTNGIGVPKSVEYNVQPKQDTQAIYWLCRKTNYKSRCTVARTGYRAELTKF